MKQYKNRIYNPNGPPTHYGHSRPTYESKRKGEPYGSKIEKHLEKLVPVEKEKQLFTELEMEDLELKDSEFGTEAEVNDFSLDERELEKEAELEQKEFMEEEDLEANLETEQKEFLEEEDIEIGHA